MPVNYNFLVGISGKIESGKDTLARMIALAMYCERTGKEPVPENMNFTNALMIIQKERIHIRKFAGPLKDMVCTLTGCTRANLEDITFKGSALPPEWNRTLHDAREWLVLQGAEMDVVYGKPDEEITEWADSRGFKFERTYRELLQELGTNILRTWIPDVHVNATLATYKPIPVPIKDAKVSGWGKERGSVEFEKEKLPKWIITDVRFPNEAEAIKERKGIVVRIERKQPEGTIGTQHSSETSLDNYTGWDVVVDNNGTLEQLYQQAHKIVKQFNLAHK